MASTFAGTRPPSLNKIIYDTYANNKLKDKTLINSSPFKDAKIVSQKCSNIIASNS